MSEHDTIELLKAEAQFFCDMACVLYSRLMATRSVRSFFKLVSQHNHAVQRHNRAVEELVEVYERRSYL